MAIPVVGIVGIAGWVWVGREPAHSAPCHVWTVVSTPALQGAFLSGVDAVSSTDVWAVGENGGLYPIVDHWDGASWTMTSQVGVADSLSAVAAISPTDVWAVGYMGGGYGVAFTEHWDGSTWTSVPAPAPGYESRLLAMAAVSSTDVWAAGFYFQSNQLHPLYVHWDGTAWTLFPGPANRGPVVYGLAAVATNDIWAVGSQASGQAFANVPMAQHWDGTAWRSVLPAPIPGGKNRQFQGGAAISSTDVWAVGYGEVSGTAFEHWDGSVWSFVHSPNRGTMEDASALSSSDVWAVGESSKLGIATATSEHWNGTTWTALATPNPGGNANLLGVTAITSTDVWAVGSNHVQTGDIVPLAMHSNGIC